jgi:hypothetical protein
VAGSLGGRVQTIEKPSRWVYLVPIIHLSACAISFIGYLIPSLQFFGIVWVFIVLVDLPVSAIFYALAWKYSLIAGLWVVVVGTLWWYFLGRAIERWIKRIKARSSGVQTVQK